MRHNQDPSASPKRKRLVFWNSTVDAVKQLLVLVLNCLSSDVALCSSAREGTTLHNDDIFGGGDALVDIAARVELPCSPDDLLLEPLSVHGARLRSLDEQSRTRSAVSYDDALENEFATRSAEVVLDRPDVTNDERLRMTGLGPSRLTWCHTSDCSRS